MPPSPGSRSPAATKRCPGAGASSTRPRPVPRRAREPSFAEHGELGTGPDARGPALLIIEEFPGRWEVRQIFDDPAGDHDWGFSAVVDLAASDEAGEAVVTVTGVGQL